MFSLLTIVADENNFEFVCIVADENDLVDWTRSSARTARAVFEVLILMKP